MEKFILVLSLMELLNETQDKFYAEIKYSMNNVKTLEIAVRSKKDFSYVEKYCMETNNMTSKHWDEVIEILKNYMGGVFF